MNGRMNVGYSIVAVPEKCFAFRGELVSFLELWPVRYSPVLVGAHYLSNIKCLKHGLQQSHRS